ncbi:MAG: Nramp family divalent metal transporter [Planctomycetales bacterium]|jgi:Mn2+/Fe2+ NRAMP family transporter
MSDQKPARTSGPLAILGPGLLVAATGVGAGDLATGALTGSRLGVAVLWVVLLGAIIKFVLNEGLARWQLATGSTVLEGTARHFGRAVIIAFLVYLCVWSFFVGSALMSACGIAAHAILPLDYPLIENIFYGIVESNVGTFLMTTFGITSDQLLPPGNPPTDKAIYGVIHSIVALGLVFAGGYRLFEKLMSVCIGVMFITVLATTIAVQPDWSAVASGVFIPTIPQLDSGGLKWTIGLMGGVGGTVTVLCYGYWIREDNREGLGELRTCRLDLLTGYVATAIFGMCMVILGSGLDADSGAKGATLIVELGDQLEASLGAIGPTARIAFLIGAWGAVASSMFGVWQSVPYLFVDSYRMIRRPSPGRVTDDSKGADDESASQNAAEHRADSGSPIYRYSLIAVATVPAVGLFVSFTTIQLAYAVVGAAFMPILALALLFLNGSRKRIGDDGRNSALATVSLIAVVVFFAWAGVYQISDKLPKAPDTVSEPSSVAPQSEGDGKAGVDETGSR